MANLQPSLWIKICGITDAAAVAAALQAGVARPSTVFSYATYATLDGVKLSNANSEDCGGSLALAFAVSCNSVFAPLGVKVGAARLVARDRPAAQAQPARRAVRAQLVRLA